MPEFVVGLRLSALSLAVDADAGSAQISTVWVLVAQCVLIMCSSLLGGYIPSLMKLTHRRMQFLISLVGGLMLGVGVLHQLPHGYGIARDGGLGLDWCTRWLLGGMVLTFFLMRWFHFHAHVGSPSEFDETEGEPKGHDHDHSHDHDHAHDHDCAHSHAHGHDHAPFRSASWFGILIGLSIHTLLDGIALAAHVEADASHDGMHFDKTFLLGIGTFLGVALHKPLDSLSITTLMASRGWSRRAQLIVNAGYALMCPLGVVLFHYGVTRFSGHHAAFVSAAMSAAAGVFICIALSDLLPEIEMHSHDRLGLSATLVAGVILAWAIGFLEPAHSHDHTDVPNINMETIEGVRPRHNHPHPGDTPEAHKE